MDTDSEGSSGFGKKVVEGVVVEVLPSALYRVRVGEGTPVTAHIADRIDRNFVRLVVGDRVGLELSPADPKRGRIVVRMGNS